jgi:hypothetical protein
LKGVLQLLRNDSQRYNEIEVVIEIRERLVDATGTVTLLFHDVSRGDANPTGLPSSLIQAPLQNLRQLLVQLLVSLSDLIKESKSADLYDDIDVSYSVPLDVTKKGPGRKRYDISKEQLEHLRSLFFSWEKISEILQVSVLSHGSNPLIYPKKLPLSSAILLFTAIRWWERCVCDVKLLLFCLLYY